jgi:hypothetical protein
LPDFAHGENRSINADFFIWQRQLFTGVSNVAFVATSVPEPGAWSLAFAGLVAQWMGWRRTRS